jgi:hypothetical protein
LDDPRCRSDVRLVEARRIVGGMRASPSYAHQGVPLPVHASPPPLAPPEATVAAARTLGTAATHASETATIARLLGTVSGVGRQN